MLALTISITRSTAQPVECGVDVPVELNKVLIEEAAAIEQFVSERGNSVEDIPVRFTALNGPGGGVHLNTGDVEIALGNLNAAFAPANLHFVQCSPINEIWDDRIKDSVDIDHFTTSFSYTSGALEVYAGILVTPETPPQSIANYSPIPAQSYQAGNPNYSFDQYDHTNFINMNGGFLLQPDFIHETGHQFGLLHTFMPNKTYDVPTPGENTPDYPYQILNASGQMEPWWWGRELVIRSGVPPGTKTFIQHNSGFAGDLTDDTPADCTYLPGLFPGCPITAQSITTCEFNSALTYADYNGDAINPPPAGLSLGHNYMSYWNRECLNQFTPKQYARIGYYYETVRKQSYTLDKCNNFTDKVEFEGGNTGLHNVTVRVRHPNDPRICNVTTNKDGEFGGILHADNLTSYAYHNGKKNTLAYAGDPLRRHFDHTPCEWLQGVSTYDLVLIAKHILGIQPLASGYSIIAADANESNSVTTFDIVELRKLILGIYDRLPVPDQPWRYIPEFIPQEYSAAFNANPFQVSAGGGAQYLTQGWGFTLTDAYDGKKGFDGIKIGDVNSSWLDTDECPKESDLPQDEGDKPELVVPSTPLLQDTVVALRFRVNNFQQTEAFQLGIRLPFEYFELLDVTNTASSLSSYTKTDNFGLTRLEEDAVRTLWFDENGGSKTLQDNSTLFTLKVRPKQYITDLSSILKLDNSILTNEFWRSNSVTAVPASLTVTVEPASGERSGNDKIYSENEVQTGNLRLLPNPVSQDSRLVFEHYGQNSQGDLIARNILGVVLNHQSLAIHTGENTIEIDAINHAGAGIYWLSLVVDGKAYTLKVVK